MEKILIGKQQWQALKKFTWKDDDDTRPMLAGLYIDAKRVVTCDGRSLLSVPRETTSAPDSCNGSAWKVISENKKFSAHFTELVIEKIDAEYPDIDKVIPAKNNESDTLKLELIEDKKHVYFPGSAPIYLYQFTGGGYSDEYLTRLLPLGATWSVSKAAEAPQNKPVRMDAEGMIAVILPYSLKTNEKE